MTCPSYALIDAVIVDISETHKRCYVKNYSHLHLAWFAFTLEKIKLFETPPTVSTAAFLDLQQT